MIISITESCHMGCSHCMDDAKPCAKHMTMRVFKNAIYAFNEFGGVECLITGGEPTDNPDWLEMLKYALDRAHGSTCTGIAHITLATNGMNIAKDRNLQTYLMVLMDNHRNFNVQVTHVKEYYPIDVNFNTPFFKTVGVCTKIEAMYPMGRARDNNLPWQAKCSKCFNIRSATRSLQDINKATLLLAIKNKFCTPQISINGDIKLGESTLCPVCSSIYKRTDEITKDICNFTCHNCDMVNKFLSKEQRQAIGEE